MSRGMQKRFDLNTVTFPPDAPAAKVFAVVGEDSVITFAYSRICATDNFIAGIFTLFWKYPHRPAIGETFQIRHFDRPRLDRATVPGVVGDATASEVNAVMDVKPARTDQMRADRRIGECLADTYS